MNEIALALFWSGVFWLFYTYLGYPAILGLLGAVSRRKHEMRDDFQPTVSVLISARNEEQDIGWKIRETLAWNYPARRLQVLIASDASEDATDDIVRGFRDPRVTLARMERRGGKGRALNRLAETANGELLFFTDANAHIGPDCLRKMVRHFADPQVGCVTGGTRPLAEERHAVSSGAGAFLSYELFLNTLESRLGSVMVCDGAIFCIRRSLYTPVLPDLANDLELPMRIASAGRRILFEPAALVREADTSSAAEEFARRRRICAQGALAMWLLRETMGGFRGWQFVSHKLMRYLTLIPMALVFVASVFLWRDRTFSGLLALQAGFYALAIWGYAASRRGWRVGRLLAAPFYITYGCIGALAGIWDSCRGRRFDVWECAAMSRGRNRQEQLSTASEGNSIR